MTNALESTVASFSERVRKAIGLVDTSPGEAVDQLEALQQEAATRGLLSTNETVAEMSAGPIQLLTLEYYLAMAYIHLPTRPDHMMDRLRYLRHASDVLAAFLSRLDQMESLSASERKQYQLLMDLTSSTDGDGGDAHGVGGASLSMMPPPIQRDEKIARHRARQSIEQEQNRLRSLVERRNRLGISSEDEMDGYDEESLVWNMAMAELDLCKIQAIDEWFGILREIPIVQHFVQSQAQQQPPQQRDGTTSSTLQQRDATTSSALQERPSPNRGLQVTRVTENPVNGQLMFRREEIRSGVFRAGWNKPTMSLQEFADREVQEAEERQVQQQQAEAQQKLAPRRYEQLIRDGMEDDQDLVDASADLDRRWDDFKDENPRGSGNKRGDVGDRNF